MGLDSSRMLDERFYFAGPYDWAMTTERGYWTRTWVLSHVDYVEVDDKITVSVETKLTVAYPVPNEEMSKMIFAEAKEIFPTGFGGLGGE